MKKVYCDSPFRHLKVRSDGEAKSCCFQHDGAIGNLITEGFEAIWNSPTVKSTRASILAGKLDKFCDAPLAFCPYKCTDLSIERFGDIPDDGYLSLPETLEIDLHPSFCNIGGLNPDDDNPACIMCGRDTSRQQGASFWGLRQEDKMQEVCEALKPIMARVRWCHIMGLAEPFWKGKIHEVLNWLGFEDDIPLIISTNTNGSILTETSINKYLDRVPRSETRFSIDAATPLTFRKIRRIDAYDKIIENLRIWNAARNRQQQKLHVASNINLFNIGEVEQMVEVVADVGVDGLVLFPTDPIIRSAPLQDEWCVNKQNVHLFREAQEKAVKRAHELGVDLSFIKPLHLNGVFYESHYNTKQVKKWEEAKPTKGVTV